MKKAKVVSVFDGMACGMIAMLNAGIEVESYDAYEINKYAIKVSSHNFPNIRHHGDVFEADFTRHEGADFVFAGFPCTKFSIAQKNDRETKPYSGEGWLLFEQAWRAVCEVKPKYFIFENNKSMAKPVQNEISKIVGFKPICINSSLVSAQNRQRLYWVGERTPDGTYRQVRVEQPKDKGIILMDILDDAVTWLEKSWAYTTRCQGGAIKDTLSKHRHTLVAERVTSLVHDGMAICRADGKKHAVHVVRQHRLTINNETFHIELEDGHYIFRILSVPEASRLQTVPKWYDFSVISNSQAYKCLGNGWTCDVITHLINATQTAARRKWLNDLLGDCL